jgi:hypothetical protein
MLIFEVDYLSVEEIMVDSPNVCPIVVFSLCSVTNIYLKGKKGWRRILREQACDLVCPLQI